ncbi:MAG TPA: ATP-binding protein [Anaerolineae bacterium]|nr:ATP-binding protein [Anaerolineae bacterium]
MVSWFRPVINFFTSSISKKIIFPYALLTLFMAALGIFIITRVVVINFEERLKNQLLETGRIVSEEAVNRERFRLEIQRVVANTIGVAQALVDRDTSTLEELILPVIANARGIDSILILDTQSQELLRLQRDSAGVITVTPNTGTSYAAWLPVQQVLTDPDGNKEALLARDPLTDQLIIYTIGPVHTGEGMAGLALVGTYLDQEVAYLHSLALAHLVLFDEQGQVLASTFPLTPSEQARAFAHFTPERYQQVLRHSRETTFLDQIDLTQATEPELVTVNEANYRLAYAPYIIRNRVYGVYAVALTTDFITSATVESQLALAAIFTLGTLTVLGIGYGLSRLISRPLLRLVSTARAIAAGQLDQRSGLHRNDEIGVLATTFDGMTTELQRLLKIQREEASKLNAILNSIADGVIVQDLQGQVLVANPTAQKILAQMQIVHPERLADLGQSKGPASANSNETSSLLQSLTQLPFRETDRIGLDRQVLSALSAPVELTSGEQLGSVIVLRDITREVESERLKDEFITSISHELKTPLTALKGYNNLLKLMLEMSAQTDGEKMSIVRTMDEELNNLDNLIQAMLDLAQIDAGELGIDQEPVDLSSLLRIEADQWGVKMKQRDLHFSTRIPDGPVWVAGDPARLNRVVHNLIKNAHDYTLPGGNVEVILLRRTDQVQVQVKDTGVGIAPDDQRFIYTRFFRAIHDEHTYEVSGAGLGLYTSKAIVEAHNGQIWMESQLHQGSTFTFALPVVVPEEVEDPAPVPSQAQQ